MNKKGQGELVITLIIGLVILVLFCVAFYYIWQLRIEDTDEEKNYTATTVTTGSHNISYGADCLYTREYNPDPSCTPGVGEDIPLEQLCQSGFPASRRDVSENTKNEVYRRYGIQSRVSGEYEMDHLIPLAIGGTNDKENLFPQPQDPRPGYKEKDQVENYLRREVCGGRMNLREAQIGIARNWTQYLPMIS